jgi:hypothetical protein
MTPDSVHLLAQLIRHSRGALTAIEKWVGKQPPGPTNLELIAVTTFCREVLTKYESQISQIDAIETESADRVQ